MSYWKHWWLGLYFPWKPESLCTSWQTSFLFFPHVCDVCVCVCVLDKRMDVVGFFFFLNLLFIEYIGNLWTLRCRDFINRSMRMGGKKPYQIKSPNLVIKMLFFYVSFTQAYYDILHVCTTHCIASFTSEPWSFNLTFTLWSGGARRELGGAGEKWRCLSRKDFQGVIEGCFHICTI